MNTKITVSAIAGIAAIIFGLHSAGWLPPTSNVLAEHISGDQKINARQDLQIHYAELRLINADLEMVDFKIEQDPVNSRLREDRARLTSQKQNILDLIEFAKAVITDN